MHIDLGSQSFNRKHGWTESEFDSEIDRLTRQLRRLELQIAPRAVPRRDSHWLDLAAAVRRSEEACRTFEDQHRGVPGQILEAQQRFRRRTDPWFCRSWIAHRARTKPSGFAGDYQMLIALYGQKALGQGIGGYLDRYIMDLPLARAVRARLRAVREFLREEVAGRRGDVRILDIASGPCREYVGWRQQPMGGEVRVTCIDNDPDALDYVAANVAQTAVGLSELQTVRYNALRTRSAKKTIERLGKFDIIYSAGLCDYLSDEQLVGLFEGWRDTLDENGVLYISMKDAARYDKTPYQWHLDWHFLQRTEDDCRRLFAEASFDAGSLAIDRDQTGMIMNFVFRRVPHRIVRIDPPVTLGGPVSDGDSRTLPQSEPAGER